MSVRFVVCILAVATVLFMSTWGHINNAPDAIYMLNIAYGGNIVIFIQAGILALIPFSTAFSIEWEQRVTRFWLIRTGTAYYAISKIIVTALSGFLTTAIGILLYVGVMHVKLPLYEMNTTGGGYAPLLDANMPTAYLLAVTIHISLTATLFAVTAFWVSTLIPNQFVTISAPLVIYLVLHRFTSGSGIVPEYLRPVVIVEWLYDAGTPLSSLLLKLAIVGILCLLLGLAAWFQLRRRFQNE
ncbi:hypothetical protein [Bacillus alkalicellulosilyticus]|uniref:hypothetical protein n=1 Tax=Alkalihalobacterium alkalicellulosilyticum TaxID=1912214 RepID=UPI001116AB9F|nr:hypothetical protein [Bacillus alkalicellulosilyticus]